MTTLRQLRLSKNMTLITVAKAIDIDVANLSRVERGIQSPSIHTAKKIASFYGITIDAVIGGSEEYKKAS